MALPSPGDVGPPLQEGPRDGATAGAAQGLHLAHPLPGRPHAAGIGAPAGWPARGRPRQGLPTPPAGQGVRKLLVPFGNSRPVRKPLQVCGNSRGVRKLACLCGNSLCGNSLCGNSLCGNSLFGNSLGVRKLYVRKLPLHPLPPELAQAPGPLRLPIVHPHPRPLLQAQPPVAIALDVDNQVAWEGSSKELFGDCHPWATLMAWGVAQEVLIWPGDVPYEGGAPLAGLVAPLPEGAWGGLAVPAAPQGVRGPLPRRAAILFRQQQVACLFSLEGRPEGVGMVTDGD